MPDIQLPCAEMTSAIEEIQHAQTIVISGHTSPDGDALGSALGLLWAIKSTWPNKEVAPLLPDNKALPKQYAFLPGAEEFVAASEYNGDPDLFISVDTPNPERLAASAHVLNRAKRIVALDHHPDMQSFAHVNIKCSNEAAAGIIVLDLIEEMNVELNPAIATCLYTAILTDSGRFQYQNTNAKAFESAAKLVDAGACPNLVAREVYLSRSLNYLKLESRLVNNLEVTQDGKVASSFVQLKDFNETGATRAESEPLIDLVRSVEGVEVCVIAREEQNGSIRGSLRSKGDLCIDDIARAIGGGGHAKAAGFIAHGDIRKVVSTIVSVLQDLVDGKEMNREELKQRVAHIAADDRKLR